MIYQLAVLWWVLDQSLKIKKTNKCSRQLKEQFLWSCRPMTISGPSSNGCRRTGSCNEASRQWKDEVLIKREGGRGQFHWFWCPCYPFDSFDVPILSCVAIGPTVAVFLTAVVSSLGSLPLLLSILPLFPSATVVSSVSGVPLGLTCQQLYFSLLLMQKFQQKGVEEWIRIQTQWERGRAWPHNPGQVILEYVLSIEECRWKGEVVV